MEYKVGIFLAIQNITFARYYVDQLTNGMYICYNSNIYRAIDFNKQELTNEYLFGGKELQNELSLSMYDFEARMQDPQLGRFWGVDPCHN